jgi:hypothetical protein
MTAGQVPSHAEDQDEAAGPGADGWEDAGQVLTDAVVAIAGGEGEQHGGPAEGGAPGDDHVVGSQVVVEGVPSARPHIIGQEEIRVQVSPGWTWVKGPLPDWWPRADERDGGH